MRTLKSYVAGEWKDGTGRPRVLRHAVTGDEIAQLGSEGIDFASMLAYVAAQYCDVQLFHFWKRVTRGKYLWVRNNFSTLMSQMVDSVMVITVTFGAAFLRGDIALQTLLVLIGSNYLFKATVALLDTGPFYLAVHYLRRYLHLQEHDTAVPGGRGPRW